MTLRPFRFPTIVLLVVLYDMSRDVPSSWARLGGLLALIICILLIARSSYKNGRKDTLAELRKQMKQRPGWFKDLGPTKRMGERQ